MFGTGKGPTNLPSDPSIDTYSLDELLSLAEGTGTLADAQVLLFGKIRNSAQKLLRKSRSKSKFESRSDKLPEHVAQVLDKTIRRIEAARSSNERIITELRGILVSLKKPTPRKR
jgi:hypothetical protein